MVVFLKVDGILWLDDDDDDGEKPEASFGHAVRYVYGYLCLSTTCRPPSCGRRRRAVVALFSLS
jgi:hypothetical protein